MKKADFILICIVSFFISTCDLGKKSNAENDSMIPASKDSHESGENIYIEAKGTTLSSRFLTPKKYDRISVQSGSFAEYLHNLPLKPHGAKVLYHNGNIKPQDGIYLAVVDQEIGEYDLHQCADAIMRLKAEYHWHRGEFDKIHFNLTNGFNVEYSEWMKGRRIIVDGNKTYWNTRNAPSNTYADLQDYLEFIYTYAGTLSLSNELPSVTYQDMQIGDVFVIGGTPGHAVLILDMAEDRDSGKKLFLLGQSYMPAQQFQILANPMNESLSPWYEMTEEENLETPEWNFTIHDLKRFTQ